MDGPYAHRYYYDVWGNITSREGRGGTNPVYSAAYTNNKMNGMIYDAAGNLTDAGGGWTFTYDATGQQATSAVGGVQNVYDGDRLRGKKTESATTVYYLRSSMLGGQIVAELDASGNWTRGYVYLGDEMLAVQQGAAVYWVHQDPLVKSKRITNAAGTVVSTIELDPWGGETNRSSNESFQPRKFTSYLRDGIGSDDAMHRRYNRWWSKFEQPDPYAGSYNLGNPQSFNRYAYVQNDPVNFVDRLGLDPVGGALGGLLGAVAGMGPGTSTVTVPIGSGPATGLNVDSHNQLLVVFLNMQRGAQRAGTSEKTSEPKDLTPGQKKKIWDEVFNSCLKRKEGERQALIKKLDEGAGGNIAMGCILGGVVGAVSGALGGGFIAGPFGAIAGAPVGAAIGFHEGCAIGAGTTILAETLVGNIRELRRLTGANEQAVKKKIESDCRAEANTIVGKL